MTLFNFILLSSQYYKRIIPTIFLTEFLHALFFPHPYHISSTLYVHSELVYQNYLLTNYIKIRELAPYNDSPEGNVSVIHVRVGDPYRKNKPPRPQKRHKYGVNSLQFDVGTCSDRLDFKRLGNCSFNLWVNAVCRESCMANSVSCPL
jgi:hypothetical protein